MLYFHANAEDATLTKWFIEAIGSLLKINILAVENPGNGLYQKKFQNKTTFTQ